MRRLGLAARIYLLIGACLAVAGVAAGVLTWQLGRVQDTYTSMIAGALEARDGIRGMQVAQRAEVVAWKNILLRGSTPEARASYGEALKKEQDAVRADARRVRARLSEPALVALLAEFESAHETHAANYRRALEVFEAGGGANPQEADAIVRGKNATATDSLGKLAVLIDEAADATMAEQDRRIRGLRWATAMCLVVAFVVLLGATRWLVRSVTGPVSRVCGELEDGASRVLAGASVFAAGADALARDAAAQAAALEETTASVASIASMTQRTSGHVGEVSAVATDVVRGVDGAGAALADLQGAMTRLRDSSARVATIAKTIEEIAFQTNMLALNAAVEAARAGDAGAGFAVVAEEVRALAQRAGQASQETAGLIEQALTDTQDGYGRVDGVAAAMRGIGQRANIVQDLVAAVNAASRQQTLGIEDLSAALARMEQTTQAAAARAEETAASSQELSAEAALASTGIGKLRTIIDGERPVRRTV